MNTPFMSGDNLVFVLESGYGVLRVLAVEEDAGDLVWHVSVLEDFYPDVETAEAALALDRLPQVRDAHIALTNYAFEKTEAARIGNTPVRDEELEGYRRWKEIGGLPSHRSVRLMLGFR
jgi:hypothetical protein